MVLESPLFVGVHILSNMISATPLVRCQPYLDLHKVWTMCGDSVAEGWLTPHREEVDWEGFTTLLSWNRPQGIQSEERPCLGLSSLGHSKYIAWLGAKKELVKPIPLPNIHARCSKRIWDEQLKAWRRLLHLWDEGFPCGLHNTHLATISIWIG